VTLGAFALAAVAVGAGGFFRDGVAGVSDSSDEAIDGSSLSSSSCFGVTRFARGSFFAVVVVGAAAPWSAPPHAGAPSKQATPRNTNETRVMGPGTLAQIV
jgi:hypothetical protein